MGQSWDPPPTASTRPFTSKLLFCSESPVLSFASFLPKKREEDETDCIVDPWIWPCSVDTRASHNPPSARVEQQLWAQENIPWRMWGYTGVRAPPPPNPLTPQVCWEDWISSFLTGSPMMLTLLVLRPHTGNQWFRHYIEKSFDLYSLTVLSYLQDIFLLKNQRVKKLYCNMLMFDLPCWLSRSSVCSARSINKPRTYSMWSPKKSCQFTAWQDCFTEPGRVDISLDWNWILSGSVREDEGLSFCSVVMSCSFSNVSEKKKIAYIFWSTFHIACSICFLNLPHRDNLIHSVYKANHLVRFGVLLSWWPVVVF